MQSLIARSTKVLLQSTAFITPVFKRCLATTTTSATTGTVEDTKVTFEPPLNEGLGAEPVKKIGGRKRPIKVAERIASLMEKAVEQDEPHFKVGGKLSYFPRELVTLLPPIAKHTPYQARFRVPLTFNKLDLRDYLYHIYGLRAYNITVQLTRPVFLAQPKGKKLTTSQQKIMTIDMDEPFIWPAKEFEEHQKDMLVEEKVHRDASLFIQEQAFRKGSDHFKPIKNLFDGVGGATEPIAQPFVSALSYRQLKNEKLNSAKLKQEKSKLDNIESLINRGL